MKHSCGYHCTKIEHVGVVRDGETILEDINIHIHCGQITTIIGTNGAGKSTLVKAIIGEYEHTGQIKFRDTRDNLPVKIKIGYVTQSINIDKNTPASVYDLFASYISKKPIFLKKDKKLYEKIKQQLSMFEGEGLIDKRVGDLSGGEMQRVLLSIATTPMPNLLVLDEPASGMDQNGLKLFYKMIDKLKRTYDVSIILVSHDLELAYRYSDSIVLLDKTVLCSGTPAEVFNHPAFIERFGSISFHKMVEVGKK